MNKGEMVKDAVDRMESMYSYLDGLSIHKAGAIISQIIYVTSVQCGAKDSIAFVDEVCRNAKKSLAMTDWNHIDEILSRRSGGEDA